MCDPASMITAGVTKVASKALAPDINIPDPTAEREKAMAEATQKANATMVANQRRRRAGRGLLADGLETTLGGTQDTTGAPSGPKQRSMLERGYDASSAGRNLPGAYYGNPVSGVSGAKRLGGS